jgi:hypothetical protein
MLSVGVKDGRVAAFSEMPLSAGPLRRGPAYGLRYFSSSTATHVVFIGA